MDIALCSLDLERNVLQFAGANNPLFIVRDNELKIIKGDRFPIGVYNNDTNNLFNNHTIQLKEGDAIYIFSDGYADQFGGVKGKKFKNKQFKEILLFIQDYDMDEQKEILKRTLEEWRGETNQVDDILVVGVKI